jgi:phage-related minor tail protein
MRAELEGPFAAGLDRAGRVLENALVRAIRSGKLGFDDLKQVALSAMAEIASAAIRSGLAALAGGASGNQSAASPAAQILGTLLGAPGRATGGPVAPGRAYVVGERGPELFVPTSSGRVDGSGVGGGRDVRVSITINAPAGEPQALGQSSRQIARAVKSALLKSDS